MKTDIGLEYEKINNLKNKVKNDIIKLLNLRIPSKITLTDNYEIIYEYEENEKINKSIRIVF